MTVQRVAVAAVIFAGLLVPAHAEATTTSTNAGDCANPVLARDLHGWGALDGGDVSRDSVADLGSVRHAFDTTGRRFYEPELHGLHAGQRWTVSTRDSAVGASGTAAVLIDFYDSAGKFLSERTGRSFRLPESRQTGGTWTLVSATVTVPAHASTAHVLQSARLNTARDTALKATACVYQRVRASPSGQQMPIGDLPADSQSPRGLSQVFSDDFTRSGRATADGGLPDGKWWGYAAGTKTTNSPNGYYDSGKTVTVSRGMLRFHLFSARGRAYTGLESPKIDGSQTYGRYDVRYRYEKGSNVAGYKSVWMTWPDDDRWNEGEIDFQEFGNEKNRTSVTSTLHESCAQAPCATVTGTRRLDPTRWHTATEIWSPGRVRAFVDGHQVLSTGAGIPTTPMHLLLQTEASDYGPVAAAQAVMNIDVDWVTIYRRS